MNLLEVESVLGGRNGKCKGPQSVPGIAEEQQACLEWSEQGEKQMEMRLGKMR